MYSIAAVLEGNIEKANEILARPGMEDFEEVDLPTMTDAVNAWRASGNEDKAKEILEASQAKLKDIEGSNEKTISAMLVSKGEETIGAKKPQAMAFNKEGLEKYVKKDYHSATQCFHQAYLLFPREIAFSLNLLQGMVDAQLPKYEGIDTVGFLEELQKRQLNAGNEKRLLDIVSKIANNADVFGSSQNDSLDNLNSG